MKKFIAVLTALAATFVLGMGIASAAETTGATAKPAAAEKKAAAAKMNQKGTVKSIDAAKGELVVTPEGGAADMTFKIKKTQGKGVKAGDAVSVSYTSEGGVNTATRINKAKKTEPAKADKK